MTPDASAATAPAALPPHNSVIVPSHNSAPFLRQALTSVLDQIPRPHEVLVQDGGSAARSHRQAATGSPNHLISLGARP